MNREKIIELARQAGLDVGEVEDEFTFKISTEIFCRDHNYYQDPNNADIGYLVQTDDLLRFAYLVAAAEREAWREESERTADAHLKQGLTIAELFEQRDALLGALQNIERSTYDTMTATLARAAIAAVEGEKT